MEVKTYRQDFAGREFFVELGRLAGQANGSVRVQYGETTLLVTATMSAHPKDADYFPLSVDYEEKYYAAGKIKGSKWIKRETRPSEEAILAGRLIDRSLRPRFSQGIRNEVQVVPTVLTFDSVNDPDVVALFGASLALMISDIPFSGPVAAVRVGRIEGKLVINPTYQERQNSDFDIVVSGTANRINMIEAGAKIVPEKEMAEAVEYGFKELQKLIKAAKLFEEEIDKIVHKNIVEQEKRPDGRKVDELRNLSGELAILPHSHGTGLFNRGTTQVLTVLTLASPGMEQWVETMEIELTK